MSTRLKVIKSDNCTCLLRCLVILLSNASSGRVFLDLKTGPLFEDSILPNSGIVAYSDEVEQTC